MSLSRLRAARVPLSIVIAVLVLAGLLVFPRAAFGVQTVTTTVSGATFPLGAPVPGTITIDLEPDEFVGLSGSGQATVTLDIVGPQSVSFDLPLDVGPFALDVNGSSLSGTVTHAAVTTGDFSGYGYGFGYKAGSEGGTITIAFELRHRALLEPPPPSLPVLPDVSDVLSPIDIPGAISPGPLGGDGAAGISAFPEFALVGGVNVPGVPGDAEIRGMDVKGPTVGGSIATIGVVVDGDPGEHDVYAEFAVYTEATSLRTFFPLPATASGSHDMSKLQGLTFIDDDTIAVVGGDNPTGSDAFVAVFDLAGGSPVDDASPVIAGFIGGAGVGVLEELVDNRPGGVAFDGTSLVVSEYQDDPNQKVTVARIATGLDSATRFDLPIGFAGASAFEGMASDPNSGSPSMRLLGVTGRLAPVPAAEDVRFIEVDPAGTPTGLWVSSGIPSGQGVTGIGLLDDPNDAHGSSLMFAATDGSRQLFVADVPAQAAAPEAGQVTKEALSIDFAPPTRRYLATVRGNPDSRFVAFNAALEIETNVELAGYGEVTAAAYVLGDGSYWIASGSAPVMLRRIDPDTGGAVGSAISLPLFVSKVGGLAGRVEEGTTFLYAYEADDDVIYKVHTTMGSITDTLNVFDDTDDAFYLPGGASGLTFGDVDGHSRLIAGRFNRLLVINPADGEMEAGFEIAAKNISGLGAGSLLIADRESGVGSIAGALLPGESPADITTAGSYSMVARVDNSSAGNEGEFGPAVQSPTVTFDLVKLGAVSITIGSHSDGEVVGSSPVTISGTVNDPTVPYLTVNGATHPIDGFAFDFQQTLVEGDNSITITAASVVSGTSAATATLDLFLDKAAPALAIDTVSSPTTSVNQTLTGTFVESTPQSLTVHLNGVQVVSQTTFLPSATTYSHALTLVENQANGITVTLTDQLSRAVTASATIVVDTEGPIIAVGYKPLLADSGVRGEDHFFVLAEASDALSGTASVTLSLPAGSGLGSLSFSSLAELSSLPGVLVKKHGLGSFASGFTTHAGLTSFPAGAPMGLHQIIVDATDAAGNVSTASFNVNVVTALNNRTAYLMPGVNYIGFPLIPSSPALDQLLAGDVAAVNPALIAAMQAESSRNVRLSDIVDVVYGYQTGSSAFTQYRPSNVPENTLDEVGAFDGMIVIVHTQIMVGGTAYEVFDSEVVSGETVHVPVAWNVAGGFADAGGVPPSRSMTTGWNLWTPHAAYDGLFEAPGFLRGAVLTPPGELAVSAITAPTRVDTVPDAAEPGGFDMVIASDELATNGPGDILNLTKSYWTYMVGGPATITP